MIISSQRFLQDEIVKIKRESRDYVVTLTPEFEYDGLIFQAVTDGHHSLAAAREDGVEPEYRVVSAKDDDRIALLETSIDDYLEVCQMDSDWYDIQTGARVW